jgi:hypothetical protein
MSAFTYSTSTESNLMKVKYGELIEKQFNMSSVVIGRAKKKNDFVGSQIERPVIQSIGGGVGAGSLPTANHNKIGKATITSKKLYAVASIDRESMKASKDSEGAFVQFTKFPVKIAVDSFNRNIERMLVRGDATGSGALVTGNASNSNVSGAGTSGSPYIVSLNTASTYFPAEFECIEEGDLLNVNSETTPLEVTAITISVSNGYATGTLSLVGTSARLAALTATGPFAATDKLYMQNSKDAEMFGLIGTIAATSSTLYGVTVGRRWQAYQKNASSAAVSTDLLNDVILNLKRQCGEAPNLILAPYHQYIKILNLMEDQKRVNLPVKGELKASLSFSAIEYLGPDGAIPIMPSRFLNSDTVLFLNDNHMELILRPGGFDWFDEDGTVFLRDSGDTYSARYGGYGQFFVNPFFQANLTSLAM